MAGSNWDAKDLRLNLPLPKVAKIVTLAKGFLSRKDSSRKEWEIFLGNLAFAAQLSPELTLKKKLLGSLLPLFHHPNLRLSLPPNCRKTLKWWSLPENLVGWASFKSIPPTLLLWTDACLSGWGVTIRGEIGRRVLRIW